MKILSYVKIILSRTYYLFRLLLVFVKKSFIKNRVFLLLTPQHENYGDHAIAKAELEFLKQDYNVIEITGYRLGKFFRFPKLLKLLFKDEAIIINGGGYLGTLWYNDGECMLRKIMQLVPDNKIIVFPQTIYYDNNDFGREEFEKSKQIYSQCSNLTLVAREKISYEIMKNAYKNVYLAPDIVLSLNECKQGGSRKGAVTMFRADGEKTLCDDEINSVVEFLKQNFESVEASDMCTNYNIYPKTRDTELESKFSQIRSKELVVTDRLHGMIFSAITGTPCIVLNSKSPKVKGVYDWIFADCEYILFTDDFDEMKSFINSVKGKSFTYDNSALTPYYEKLRELIKEN